jgi:hypothetical protein
MVKLVTLFSTIHTTRLHLCRLYLGYIMLRLDLFNEAGNWIQGDANNTAMDLSTSPNDKLQDVDHAALLDSDLELSRYFRVPSDFLNRIVRNKSELAALQRIGVAASELDDLVSQIRAYHTSNRASTTVCTLLLAFLSAVRVIEPTWMENKLEIAPNSFL